MEIRARPRGLIFIQKIRTKERSEVYENGNRLITSKLFSQRYSPSCQRSLEYWQCR